MGRIHEWKEFELTARDIFANDPANTRFSIKHKTTTTSANADDPAAVSKKKCTAIIKVTDDKRNISYHTSERAAVQRLARMTQWFITRMSTTEAALHADPATLKQPLMH